jgi:hypothetical protein
MEYRLLTHLLPNTTITLIYRMLNHDLGNSKSPAAALAPENKDDAPKG